MLHLYSPRTRQEMELSIMVMVFGGSFLSSLMGGAMRSFWALPPHLVAMVLLMLMFEFMLSGKFRPLVALGVACGSAMVAASSAIPLQDDGNLSLFQIALTAIGFLLFLRFFSEGPEPDGWSEKTLRE